MAFRSNRFSPKQGSSGVGILSAPLFVLPCIVFRGVAAGSSDRQEQQDTWGANRQCLLFQAQFPFQQADGFGNDKVLATDQLRGAD